MVSNLVFVLSFGFGMTEDQEVTGSINCEAHTFFDCHICNRSSFFVCIGKKSQELEFF